MSNSEKKPELQQLAKQLVSLIDTYRCAEGAVILQHLGITPELASCLRELYGKDVENILQQCKYVDKRTSFTLASHERSLQQMFLWNKHVKIGDLINYKTPSGKVEQRRCQSKASALNGVAWVGLEYAGLVQIDRCKIPDNVLEMAEQSK